MSCFLQRQNDSVIFAKLFLGYQKEKVNSIKTAP